MTTRRWRRPSWFAIVLTLAGMAVFARLGVWQIARMHEKQAMLDAVAMDVSARHAVPLAQAMDASRSHEYDWAQGTGAFANMDPIFLDDQMRDGRVGVQVYMVFYYDVAGEPGHSAGAMLVDMGWVPWSDRRAPPDISRLGIGSNVHELRGLLTPPPASGLRLGKGFEHLPRGNGWLALRIEPEALAPVLLQWTPAWKPRLAPRVLRLDPALPFGFARDLNVLPNTLPPSRHRGYAVTWFGFAIVALIIFIVLHWVKVEK